MAELLFDISPADRPVLEDILRSTGYFYDFEIDVALSIADETFEKGQDKSGYYWVCIKEEGKLIGFANFGLNPSSVHSWDLYWIVVRNEYRSRHYGSWLLREAEEQTRSHGGKILWIETSGRPLYEPTRHFYLKNGYELAAQLKDFYGPGDDKLIYRKEL